VRCDPRSFPSRAKDLQRGAKNSRGMRCADPARKKGENQTPCAKVEQTLFAGRNDLGERFVRESIQWG